MPSHYCKFSFLQYIYLLNLTQFHLFPTLITLFLPHGRFFGLGVRGGLGPFPSLNHFLPLASNILFAFLQKHKLIRFLSINCWVFLFVLAAGKLGINNFLHFNSFSLGVFLSPFLYLHGINCCEIISQVDIIQKSRMFPVPRFCDILASLPCIFVHFPSAFFSLRPNMIFFASLILCHKLLSSFVLFIHFHLSVICIILCSSDFTVNHLHSFPTWVPFFRNILLSTFKIWPIFPPFSPILNFLLFSFLRYGLVTH